MRSKLLGILLALGFLVAADSGAIAQVPPAPPTDSTIVKPDSSMAKPDTTAAKPVAPAPAAATPAPAATPPPAAAAAAPAAAAAAPPAATTAATKSVPNDRIYYGGTVTVSFGSTTSFGVFPMVAYKLTPKISAGVEAGYEHVSYNSDQSTDSYGGGIFGRMRIGRNLYAHAEYQNINYEVFHTLNTSSREWVPSVLLGGGYIRSLGGRMSVYGEVLFDVLQDDNSPYNDWEPIVSFGVAVGF
jgi:hypothetical protein